MTNPNHRLQGEELLAAIATGRMNGDVQTSVMLALQLWLAHGGKTPLTRFLRLPTSGPKLQQASRDLWLRRAAVLLPGQGPYAKARTLCNELDTFVCRGAWSAWQHSEAPPDDASELRKCLFFAMKYGGAKPIEERQIYRILS